jgi:flagellar basal-body rod protein FlgG
MNDSLYIAATGMQVQQQDIDTVANNIVNLNTMGFKASRVNFQEMMSVDGTTLPTNSTTNIPGTANSHGIGIAVTSVNKDFSAGTLTQTNSPMDIAINGSGFIEVTLADGSHAYSRGGTLQITKDSYLATSNGYVLKPSIHVPANISAISIDVNGKVSVQTSPQAQPIDVGQIELANFSNPSALKSVGNGVYTPTDTSGQAVFGKPGVQGFGAVQQGSLENSNVTLANEMVTLMVAQRAYELSSKVAQISDEIMSLTNNLRR